MKIAAFYARVSTERQEKEATIESQIDELEKKIKDDGNVLGENLRFIDNGWSGDLLARPALDQMRDSASKKEFEILYVWDRDRIARRYAYQEIILEEIENSRIQLIDLHSSEAKTPEDKILLGFKGLFAEYEKTKIAERMRRGKLFKARNGKIVLGPGPYGYKYILKSKDNEGYLEINEEEASIVRLIFNWIGNEGLSIRAVIKRLYDLKITPRKSKSGHWGNSTLCRLLRNKAYVGTVFYNKSQAVEPKTPQTHEKYKRIRKSSRVARSKEDWIAISVPSIIDEELFDKTQEQLKINALHSPRNKKHDYLLSGLIYCDCGSRMGCEGGEKNYYYRCQNRLKRYPLPPDCSASGLNTGRIDDIVWNKLKEFFQNHKLLEAQAARWLGGNNDNQSFEDGKIEEIKKHLLNVGEEERRQAKAYGEGIISFDLFKKLVSDIKDKKEALTKQLQEFTNRKLKVSEKSKFSLEQIIKALPLVINKFEEADKRKVLLNVLDKVEVNESRTYAKIRGYLPINYEGKEELNANYWDCGVT